MRAALPALLAAALLAACTEGGAEQAPPATTAGPPATETGAATETGEATETGATSEAPPETAPPETGATETVPERLLEASATLRLFIAAAGAGDAGAMWELLSQPTRERFGPEGSFDGGLAVELEEGVGSFARATYDVVVASEPSPGFAAAAVAGERAGEGQPEFGAYAAALRLEGDAWRVELGGPVRLTPIIPGTGTFAPDAVELAVELESEAPVDGAALWLDGRPVDFEQSATDEGDPVLVHRPPEPLAPGPHVAVAFALAGDEASALAWVLQVSEGA